MDSSSSWMASRVPKLLPQSKDRSSVVAECVRDSLMTHHESEANLSLELDLEISRPQESGKSKRERRRSRSPGGNRGNGAGRAPAGVDRYTSGQSGGGGSPRDRDFRRGRDDYRPSRRDPSPDYRGGRDRERYGRERSRSPYGRDRYRTRTPERDVDDDLPLPKRNPSQVPDVQIIVADELDR